MKVLVVDVGGPNVRAIGEIAGKPGATNLVKAPDNLCRSMARDTRWRMRVG
jgi:hypothetical protein